ncbi:MAG: tetratricopeptide repeat protein, partial [Vicinamibacterales bacterium]
MRLTRSRRVLALLVIAGGSLLAIIVARRGAVPIQTPAERGSPVAPARAASYADPSVCATCHEDVAPTYALTGMARSFSRVSAAQFATPDRVYHKASDRYYTMVERDGRFYQRRHQIGFGGTETNVLELEAQYVIGSGNHARTFLHRTPDGRLVQLPVSWYAERGGYWAMSPGYDRAGHMDFRRVIDAGCLSCHNGYPRGLVEDDPSGPRFGDAPLPEGIDCQRCHGPGQAHVEAVKSGDTTAIRLAIVNPAKLDRDRQLETCMQCHLESTSSPLPFRIHRDEHPPFSYTPGKPLSDYFIHFDHAPGTPRRDDKFEIASGAYRLRKSACFQRSEMTCLTCHNPHDVPRGPKAVARQVAVCQGCHNATHRGGVPRVPGAGARATCIDCHMPKRRTEDAVHVVMTDHYIQRRPLRPDLVAARSEVDSLAQGDYRGEVVLYYPSTLPSTPENELAVALAQVQQGSNLTAGIPQLEHAIDKHRPGRPVFYYELARAYARSGNHEAAIRWCREALRRDARFVPALKELAAAATTMGNAAQAAESLEQAVALGPRDANAAADLGGVYMRQGRLDDAERVLQRALALDPTLPLANNTMGLTALRQGAVGLAETHFREAIRLQPDLAEAHNNLGNLLAGRRAYAEAAYHFEKAIASNPRYVEARHSFGVTLALTGSYTKAVTELQAAVALAPQLVALRIDLADVLATTGRRDEARVQFMEAAKSGDAGEREAALAGLRSLERPG